MSGIAGLEPFTADGLAALSIAAVPETAHESAAAWVSAVGSPLGSLVWRPTIYSRNGTAYLACRSWRADARAADLALLKDLKRSLPDDAVAAIAAELAHVATALLGGAAAAVVPVACGHSKRPDCLSVRLADRVAAALGVQMVEAFAPRFVTGSSHPKEFRKLPPLDVVATPTGPTLVVDDLITSGFHMEEALRNLRERGVPAIGAAWIGGTIAG